MLAVVVPGRGVIRWNRDGIRKTIPFPDSAHGTGRAFLNEVDDVIAARRPLSPIEQAALVVEAFPGATIRDIGGTSTPTVRPKARRPSARDRRAARGRP